MHRNGKSSNIFKASMHLRPEARHRGTFPKNMKVFANNVLITFCTVGIVCQFHCKESVEDKGKSHGTPWPRIVDLNWKYKNQGNPVRE